jgi:hypothetical protein
VIGDFSVCLFRNSLLSGWDWSEAKVVVLELRRKTAGLLEEDDVHVHGLSR